MGLFFIAASDLDMIIGIIAVVGWILAQIFGKKKADDSPQGPVSPDSSPSLDPRDELRKFFDELEKVNKPQETGRTAVPPPPLQQAPPRERPVRRIQASEPRVATITHQPQPDYTTFNTPLAFHAMQEAIPSVPAIVVKPTQSPIMPELRHPRSLRKFIIANEILGKPVALR